MGREELLLLNTWILLTRP